MQGDIIDNYQQKLINGSNRDAAERDRSVPSYAPLMCRLSSYKTLQEKTVLNQKDLPQYDMSEFHASVLNDRGPEPLTIDDVPRDSSYIRNTVMNLREYGQRSNLSPFLNEVQLYETQRDLRGTENIPTDRLRAQMFLSKTDFYKRNLYVDDIGNMRTEQVSDFERRDLNWQQQEQSKKRTILFSNETINYNQHKGAINPRTTEDAIQLGVQKYKSLKDQLQYDQKYQIKQKTWNDIHDDKFNFQAVPDHKPRVADYSQVFITNAGSMPLNYLYAFSKQKELDKEQFEAQQQEFNENQRQKQLSQYMVTHIQPQLQTSRQIQQEQDQQRNQSLISSFLGKLRILPNSQRKSTDKEDRQLNQYFEVLIQHKRKYKDLCNQYYNRLQCISDSMKILNLDSNQIYKMPHQIDKKAVADLQIIEDFLVIARSSPQMTKYLRCSNKNSLQSQQEFDSIVMQLAEKYLSNQQQIPRHLMQQLTNNQVQQQDFGKQGFQGNKKQLHQELDFVLSAFNPQMQQQTTDNNNQLLLHQQIANFADNRVNSQYSNHQFSKNQDFRQQKTLLNPLYSTVKKQSDLNPNTMIIDKQTNEFTTVSNNEVSRGLPDQSLNNTRAPQYVDYNLRFNHNREKGQKEL